MKEKDFKAIETAIITLFTEFGSPEAVHSDKECSILHLAKTRQNNFDTIYIKNLKLIFSFNIFVKSEYANIDKVNLQHLT